MAGVKFSHPDQDIGDLILRLPPVSVEWTYNMNTRTWDTYSGQVVQLLSINFDRLIITGKFGREGAWGQKLINGIYQSRPVDELTDYKTRERFGVGLTQMTDYFRSYFAVASQGHDAQNTGNYDQRSISLTYQGALDVPIDTGKEEKWLVYPVSFPSYRRSNEDFAPEWRVECEVVEPAIDIRLAAEQEAIQRLREAVGYRPMNKFSDPLGRFLPADLSKLSDDQIRTQIKKAQAKVDQDLDSVFGHFKNMIPAYTPEDLEALLLMNGSLPLAKPNPADQHHHQG